MIRHASGVVLLTTVMMIAILMLLVLSLMQGVFLYIKSGNQIVMNHQSVYQMEAIANKLDLSKSACVVEGKNPNQLVALLSESRGCLFDDGAHQYRYVLADLGTYPCLQINLGGISYGSHHWLVTLVSIQPPNVVLQLRFTEPAKGTVCELPTARQIYPGVVSWRKFG